MSTTEKEKFIHRIDIALNDIRPHLAVDGGNIEVVGITEDMKVQVRLLGSCSNCSMSEMTMRAGVEGAIKGKIPEITGIVAVE